MKSEQLKDAHVQHKSFLRYAGKLCAERSPSCFRFQAIQKSFSSGKRRKGRYDFNTRVFSANAGKLCAEVCIPAEIRTTQNTHVQHKSFLRYAGKLCAERSPSCFRFQAIQKSFSSGKRRKGRYDFNTRVFSANAGKLCAEVCIPAEIRTTQNTHVQHKSFLR